MLAQTAVVRPRTRTPRPPRIASRALVVIDHEQLQGVAWAEFHSANKRLEKITCDLHRHEEIDCPAYEEWLHRTFPFFVTTLRELHQDVTVKSRQVQAVKAMTAVTGRSPKKLWRALKDYESNPDSFDAEAGGRESSRGGRGQRADGDFYEDDERSTRRSRSGFRDAFETSPPARKTRPTRGARAIYYRLVQRLHPDRGGPWTTVRQRLWHEIQQAWTAADADWLARLEVEWETAHEPVGPTSPLSRLRRALEELQAARRDAEQKLRGYRTSSQWRFTLSEKKRADLYRRTKANFEQDLELLQRQLTYLNSTIAAWESKG